MKNNLEMHPSDKYERPTAVVVDKSSKSSLYDNGEERKEQVGYYLIANEKAIKYLQRMTTSLRDSAKMEDILRGAAPA